jgi:glycosyltransferase involved in cell wall biosynthesis
MKNNNFVSIIMDTYYRPAMLKKAYEAIATQTFDKLEIILVNNGATPETIEFLHEAEQKDKRVKLIHFTENQFSWDDPYKLVVCYNEGLNHATGKYVWYQSDDDIIANDYIERMVSLFESNSDCITAAGLPVSIDNSDQIIDVTRNSNYRSRYMPGHLLALDLLRHPSSRSSILFGAPGTIFTIKRDVLIKAGGFHRTMELSQLYSIVPFGITGFDEEAIFYWRKHDLQLNKILTKTGRKGFGEFDKFIKDCDIQNKWQQINHETARLVVKKLRSNHCKECAGWFVYYMYRLNFVSAMRIVKLKGDQIKFWIEIPFQIWIRIKDLSINIVKIILKALFNIFPNIGTLSTKLAKLQSKSNNW